MSWIEDRRLERFFRRLLVPAATALRERGVRFFPSGPEAEQESWYSEVPADEPEFGEIDAEQIGEILSAHWQEQGLPELAELGVPLQRLARQLKGSEEESADVSPFVYVMY